MHIPRTAEPAMAGAAMNASCYRTVWRWHFYAGLIILPVLVWLAVTGSLYLYKPEIERAVYGEWIALDAPAEPMPIAAMIDRVEQETGGRVTQVIRPAFRDGSWRMNVADEAGTRRTAFVDPASGDVLGTTSEGGVMETVRTLHSLAITGPVGNALVEIVAGWAIILVVSGFYLWWPRRGQKAIALRGRPRERRFWRDFHASAGALVGAVILFLAVSGMPWSIFWGAALQEVITANDLGRPAAPGTGAGGHEPSEHEMAGHADPAQQQSLPWSMQAAAPPIASGAGDIGPDRVAAIAASLGLAAPYTLSLPTRPGAPYAVSRLAERESETHLIYVDPLSGRVLQDVSSGDMGAAARVVEWGIYTHQGQTYGELNRLVMLAGCIGIVLLAISAPILWWKRRRSGRLAAPPRPAEPRRGRGFIALMIGLGILYPLTGLTMLLAAAADRLLLRRRAAASG